MAELTPRKENGRVDWLAFIRTTWPILVAVVLLTAWFGQRMESPAAKEMRIRSIVNEMVPPREVRDDLSEMKADIRELTLAVRRLEVAFAKREGKP